ncbi:MAG: S-adenosylmethionine:tRNA ribosyltransferase-isomerase, partial [Chitinophagaceae bacterium]
GTTSLRTLESLYWLGAKISQQLSPDSYRDGSQQSTASSDLPIAIGMSLSQWEAYELNDSYSPERALKSLLQWMDENKMDRLLAKTQIIIAPGYKPKIVKALVTNFHQPQSTLLLLIAALIGEKWKEAYQYALEHDFRFLSYGDGCLLWISPWK